MPERKDAHRNEGYEERRPRRRDEAPPASAGEDDEGTGEERPQQSTPRVGVREESDEGSRDDALGHAVPLEPRRPLEPEEQSGRR